MRKDNVVSFEECVTDSDRNIPAELFSFLKLVTYGEKRDALQMNDAHRTSVKQQTISCASNIMYISKTERQVIHKTDLNFRTSLDYENKSVISKAILLKEDNHQNLPSFSLRNTISFKNLNE